MVADPTTITDKPSDLSSVDDAQNPTAAAAAADTKAGDETVRIADSERVNLAILSDITAAQSAHGLKHSDYDRYRTYCTRRLSRVRTATRLTNRQQYHQQQQQQNQQANKYVARAVTPADVVRDGRALTIPLILSERDWAFAMAVKRNASSPPTRARRAVHAHLSRAVEHAVLLSQLARAAANEQTMLEAEAYVQGMRATLALEREAWATALPAYEVAHKIYRGMAGVRAGTSGATLYERKVEEISQAIRFCKYNLARSGQSAASANGSRAVHAQVNGSDVNSNDDEEHDEAALLEELRSSKSAGTGVDASDGLSDALSGKIEAALAEARRRAAQSFGHVSWCGVDVALRSERVREAVLTAEQKCKSFLAQQQEHTRKADEYDSLFVVLNDAVKVVSDELKEFRNSAGASDTRVEELELIVAYLTYSRLLHTIDRNLIVVDSLRAKAKPDDYVRMYDNLISNVSDMLALKGVDADAALVNEVTARKRLFQACRCFHLAQCYQAAQLPAEAAALFDRVAVHARAVTSGRYATEAKRVVHESRGMKCRARAQAFLDELSVTSRLSGMHLHNGDPSSSTNNNMDGNPLHENGDDEGVAASGGAQAINDGGYPSSAATSTGKYTMLQHLDQFKSFVPLGDDAAVTSVNPAGQGVTAKSVAICDLPPPLEAVPCKPVLFDLAIDGIRLPSEKTGEEDDDAVADDDAQKTEVQQRETKKASEDKQVGESETVASTGYATSILKNSRLGRWWSGSS